MRHPLEFTPQNLQKPLLYVFLALTILIFGIFGALDVPLRNPFAPNGIVSLELAGTPDKAFSILASWDPVNIPLSGSIFPKFYAAFGLGLDYLFMPVYAFALGFGTLLAAAKHKKQIKLFCAIAGWGAFAAALFDMVENYMLFRILLGDYLSPKPEIAALCATIKFFLLVFGLIVIGVARATRK
ncbi:MAG: hypothetical protein HYZ23_01385 [Chloroflexi bacterium]|nr:hypothetical protein [Chloroflexota bacterium]